jgi:membrane protein
MTLIYRFAMSREPVAWRPSIIGGAAAAALVLLFSWACAVYVDQIAHLGATYGSLTAVVVFLIWLSWNVNAIFFGGALATEVELALHIRRTPVQMSAEVLAGLTHQETEPPVQLDNLDQL